MRGWIQYCLKSNLVGSLRGLSSVFPHPTGKHMRSHGWIDFVAKSKWDQVRVTQTDYVTMQTIYQIVRKLSARNRATLAARRAFIRAQAAAMQAMFQILDETA
jgi:hypothetical protein